jgi:hypothetical protein
MLCNSGIDDIVCCTRAGWCGTLLHLRSPHSLWEGLVQDRTQRDEVDPASR